MVIHESRSTSSAGLLEGNAMPQKDRTLILPAIVPKNTPIPDVRMSQYVPVHHLLIIQTARPASASRVVSVMVVVVTGVASEISRLSAILTTLHRLLVLLLFLVLLVLMFQCIRSNSSYYSSCQ